MTPLAPRRVTWGPRWIRPRRWPISSRLLDLHATLAEAQRCHDLARAAQARAEIDWLSSELAAAVGLGGRDRQVGADAERARSTVTKAIKAAVHKLVGLV